MAKENNFTKAVKELLGERDNMDAEQGVSAPRRRDDKSAREEPAVNPAYMPPSVRTGERSSFISAASDGVASSQQSEIRRRYDEEDERQPVRQPSAPRVQESQMVTFINKDTVITGSITSKTDVRNEGQVTGDIVTSENIWVTGKVDGDLDGNIIQVIGGYVVGNIKARSDVCNDSASIILGDISGDNFVSDGKVKGNLKINNAVSLKNNAVVYGNVSARKLSVQDGAIIKGNVQIISPKTVDDDMFAVPKAKRTGPSDDDMFKIPVHPAVTALEAEDEEYDRAPYQKPATDTSDLLASFKERMMDKSDDADTVPDDEQF